MFTLLLTCTVLQTVFGSFANNTLYERDSLDKCYGPPTSIQSFYQMKSMNPSECARLSLHEDSWRLMYCSVNSEDKCSIHGVSSIPPSYEASHCQCYTTEYTCMINGHCGCVRGLYGDKCQEVVTDCLKAKDMAMGTGDQVTWIKPNPESEAFLVLCDYEYGYTYIQYRPKVECKDREEFDRPWKEYVNGFGNVGCEHWLGLEKVHQLTSQRGPYQLDVLVQAGPNWGQCFYNLSYIDDILGNFIIHFAEAYTEANDTFVCDSLLQGTMTNSTLSVPFSTYDHDSLGNGCPVSMRSGWWFTDDCTLGNLNGPYLKKTGFAANQTQSNPTLKDSRNSANKMHSWLRIKSTQ